MQNLVLMGAPGSGKSTLARHLATYSGGTIHHISSGAIAAELAEHDTHTQEALQRGDYAPESAIRMEVMAQIEAAIHQAHNFVLEGFPRRLDQMILLERIALEKGFHETLAYVHVVHPLYACLHRVLGRKRGFDEPDAIASRFDAFQRDTLPMLYMLKSGEACFAEVSSDGPVYATADRLMQLV